MSQAKMQETFGDGVIERGRATVRRLEQRRLEDGGIVRERRAADEWQQLYFLAEADAEQFIVWPAGTREGRGGALDGDEFAAHALAVIHDQAERERDLAAAKQRDLLQLSFVIDVKHGGCECRHAVTVRVGHRHRQDHHLRASGEGDLKGDDDAHEQSHGGSSVLASRAR